MQSEAVGPPHAAVDKEKSTNGKAIGSVVLGVVGVTGVPFVAAIVAIVLGHMARQEIAVSGQEGKGLATTGIVLGWIGLTLALLAIMFFSVLFVSGSSN